MFVYTLARAIDERRLELKKKSNDGSIITMEEQQLSLFRSLRFKSFFIASMAACLESILGRKVDPETIAFKTEECKSNSLLALVAAWTPVVEAVLSLVATRIDSAKFAERASDESLVGEVSKDVSAILYASRKSLQLDTFIALVPDR